MTAAADSVGPATGPGFRATLASEWMKLWSVPFTRRMVGLAVLLAIGAAALFLLTSAITEGTPLAELSPVDAASTSLLGTDLAVLVLIVVGASAAASEHSTGLIQHTLLATPRRNRPLLAKAAVVALTAVGTGTVASAAALGAGRVILALRGVPAIALADPRLLRLFAGSVLMALFYAVLAVAFGALLRSTGGAVALVLAIMSVPALVNALGGWWRTTLLRWLPASALHSVSGSAAREAAEYLPVAAAAIVLVAWLALALALAAGMLARRDT